MGARYFARALEEGWPELRTDWKDPAWEAEIRRFWDRRLPIALSVGDGYAYYALSAEDGAVVYGREPEFEECAAVAASPAEFLEKLRTGAIRL